MIDAADIRTFRQIEKEMPAFSYNRLRYLWNNREKNGMDALQVFIKLGRKRMVVKQQLNAWVTQQGNGSKS